MGPLGLVRLVLRLFRIDPLQMLGSVVLVALFTWAFIYNLAEDTSSFGVADNSGETYLISSIAAFALAMRVAQHAAEAADVSDKKLLQVLASFIAAAVLIFMGAALSTGIVTVLLYPGYAESVRIALILQTAFAVAGALFFWVSAGVYPRWRDRRR